MSVHLPGKYGAIIRKSAHAYWTIERARHGMSANWYSEDDQLISFTLAMSYDELARISQDWEASGLKRGADFVLASSVDGVLEPMPDWLCEEEGETFSVPGPQVLPRKERRLTSDEEEAKREAAYEERRAQDEREMIARSDEVAARRWPTVARMPAHEESTEALASFVGECWALVAFVEGCRLGGAPRSWVERNFPDKRWHISVANGYTHELRELLKAFYKLPHSLTADRQRFMDFDAWTNALLAIRRRAGEYIAGLEKGRLQGTVDLECYEAWISHTRST